MVFLSHPEGMEGWIAGVLLISKSVRPVEAGAVVFQKSILPSSVG
jgi:hypothetical protein